ncbi:hypothetical protein V8C37DRAFT_4442 [Trichoderma ceciliae]
MPTFFGLARYRGGNFLFIYFNLSIYLKKFILFFPLLVSLFFSFGAFLKKLGDQVISGDSRRDCRPGASLGWARGKSPRVGPCELPFFLFAFLLSFPLCFYFVFLYFFPFLTLERRKSVM